MNVSEDFCDGERYFLFFFLEMKEGRQSQLCKNNSMIKIC